jgi:hypothetical protein
MQAQDFRFGARVARVSSDDPDFLRRFTFNFLDCVVSGGYDDACPQLEVRAAGAGTVQAMLTGVDPAADAAALPRLFPELALRPAANDGAAIRFDAPRAPGRCAVRLEDRRLEIDAELPWQALLGHYFLHCVMRQQPELLFLHAASAALHGRGILLCGEKGAGKSTLSLALAARGHEFLGDEVGVVDPLRRELLPFRRRASLRQGPQGAAVLQYLARHPAERETLADGSVRDRVQVSAMFGAGGDRPVPLAAAYFLGPRDARPSLRRIDFEWHDLPHVSPLAATMAARPAGERALCFLTLFRSIPCFGLRPGGTPDETADLIEASLEA